MSISSLNKMALPSLSAYSSYMSGRSTLPGYSAHSDSYNANPYLNLTYTPTVKDSILRLLGNRAAEDRFYQDSLVAAKEYDAKLTEQFRQDEYNDPASQASRERAAGINPDLLGTEGVAQAAGSPGPDETSPDLYAGADAASAESMDVLDLPSRVIGSVFDMAAKYQSLRGLRLDNTVKETDAALNFVSSFFTIPEGGLYSDNDESWAEVLGNSYEGLMNHLTPNYRDIYKRFGLSSKDKSLSKEDFIKKHLGNLRMRSAYADYAAKYAKSLKDRAEGGISPSEVQPLHDTALAVQISDNKVKTLENEFNMTVKSLEDPSLKANALNEGYISSVAESQATAAESGYKNDYYSNLEGGTAATATNAENKRREAEAKFHKDVFDLKLSNLELIAKQCAQIRKISNPTSGDLLALYGYESLIGNELNTYSSIISKYALFSYAKGGDKSGSFEGRLKSVLREAGIPVFEDNVSLVDEEKSKGRPKLTVFGAYGDNQFNLFNPVSAGRGYRNFFNPLVEYWKPKLLDGFE